MLGLLLGVACGAAEFYLLRVLVLGISKGGVPIWVLPAKLLVLAAFLVPCALLLKDQLMGCGIAAAATLIGFSLVWFVLLKARDRSARNAMGSENK